MLLPSDLDKAFKTIVMWQKNKEIKKQTQVSFL